MKQWWESEAIEDADPPRRVRVPSCGPSTFTKTHGFRKMSDQNLDKYKALASDFGRNDNRG